MNSASRRGFALCVLLVSTSMQASAQDAPRFFFRGGPAYANFDASAHVSLAGSDVPGGDASVHSNTGTVLEAGYAFHPNWQLTFAFGIPPKARIFGNGTLSSTGKLGKASYAPSVLGVLYVPPVDGPLRPYIGGGVNYTLIYNVRDAALSQLHVNNAFGVALQFGAEYALGSNIALFVGVKKIWLNTKGSGSVQGPGGAQAANARITLDPVIVSPGLSFHF